MTCVPAVYGADSAYTLTETSTQTKDTVTKYEISNSTKSYEYTDSNGAVQSVNYNSKTANPKYYDIKYNVSTQTNPNYNADSPYSDNQTTNNRITINEGQTETLDSAYIGNFPGWQSSWNEGGAIVNRGAITSLTGDIIRNYMLYDNVQGGAVYNNGSNASIGSITGDFIGNVVFTNKEGDAFARGGAVFNAGGANIGEINGSFIGNYAQGTGSDTQGGAIFNSGSIIGDITGDFLGNYVHVKADKYGSFHGDGNVAAAGGAIYNIENAEIGNIKGNFINNYIQNDGWSNTAGGAIFNTASIKDITGDFINNTISTNYCNSEGGAIYNTGSIGNITGSFSSNSAIGNRTEWNNGELFAQGGAIYNNGSNAVIGNIVGDFTDNYAKIVDSNGAYQAKGGAIFNGGGAEIKGIEGNFIGNYAQGKEYSSGGSYYSQGGAIANISGSTIGDIKGDFIDNHAIGYQYGNSYGGAIYNDEASHIGNIVSNFIMNNSSTYGGAIANFGGSTIESIKADFINNNAIGSAYYKGGGAIWNNASKIGDITGNFLNNKSRSASSSNHMFGGAIYNSDGASIGNIIADYFQDNSSLYGGAIANVGTSTIESIKGDFINNSASYSGGAIYNSGTIVGDIIGNFVGNSSGSDGSAVLNAGTGVIGNIKADYFAKNTGINVILNGGTIGNINGDFTENICSDLIILNDVGNINNITGDFQDNTVGYLLIYNVYGSIDNIEGNFINNSFRYQSLDSTTIYNRGGTIGNISGVFQNNSDFNARGICNYNGIIKNIIADFTGNASNYYGGGIANTGTIESIKGDFIANSVKTTETSVGLDNLYRGGGAIYNNGKIGYIVNSSFKDNYVNALNDFARGGAIYTAQDLNIIAQDGYLSVFDGNYIQNNGVKDEQAIFVGAVPKYEYYKNNKSIYNIKNPSLDLTAKTGGTFLINDKISGTSVAEGRIDVVWNSSLGRYTCYYVDENDNQIDAPEELTNYKLNFTGDETGTVILNNNVESEIFDFTTDSYSKGGQADINLYMVTLRLGKRDNVLDGNNLTLKSGTMNMINNQAGVSALNSLTVNGDTKFYGDVDLKNEVMDRFTADSYGNHSGNVVVSGLNMVSDMAENKNSLKILFAQKGLKDYVSTEMGELPHSVQTDYYTPIFKYNVSYVNEEDAGYFEFMRGGRINSGGGYDHNDPSNFNPAVLATPVGMQAGAQAAINETFKYSFEHADTFSKLPSAVRFAQINANKYAITDFNNNMPSLNSQWDSKGVWVRPYTTFESFNLDNGPNVNAVTYGSLFGFDTDMREMKNGWTNVFTGYIGYNGSSLSYANVDTTMNGGMLGFTETFYKKNFWTAVTMSAGATVGEAHTMYGKDDFTSLLAGIGSKTGYNLEFKNGKFIVQPIMFLSYSFINTFDYTNAAGVKINSDPLHTIQVNPSIRFIANLENGWQPYASVGMVWNILNDTKVTANNVRLPQMSIKPYVEYGVGIQRNWADKFTAYFQTMIRNGGRNGIALSGGFRWAIGAQSKGREKHTIKENI